MDIGASFMEIGGKSTTVYLTVFMKATKDAPISFIVNSGMPWRCTLSWQFHNPPPQCFFDVKWTDDFNFGISMISSSED
jgi:hypothetical protein